jgi:hypothetical protein
MVLSYFYRPLIILIAQPSATVPVPYATGFKIRIARQINYMTIPLTDPCYGTEAHQLAFEHQKPLHPHDGAGAAFGASQRIGAGPFVTPLSLALIGFGPSQKSETIPQSLRALSIRCAHCANFIYRKALVVIKN